MDQMQKIECGFTNSIPIINSFFPGKGVESSIVSIYGLHFLDVANVDFNGVSSLTFTVVSETLITAVVPFGARSGKLSVVTTGGTATSTFDFTVVHQPPIINSFFPDKGVESSIVSIYGLHFLDVANVDFNGVSSLTFTVVSETLITAVVPFGARSGKLSVVTTGGTATSTFDFTVS